MRVAESREKREPRLQVHLRLMRRSQWSSMAASCILSHRRTTEEHRGKSGSQLLCLPLGLLSSDADWLQEKEGKPQIVGLVSPGMWL